LFVLEGYFFVLGFWGFVCFLDFICYKAAHSGLSRSSIREYNFFPDTGDGTLILMEFHEQDYWDLIKAFSLFYGNEEQRK